MVEHACNKEEEITEIHSICKRLDESLRGNGKPGLFTDFAVWKSRVTGLIALNMIIIVAIATMWFKFGS